MAGLRFSSCFAVCAAIALTGCQSRADGGPPPPRDAGPLDDGSLSSGDAAVTVAEPPPPPVSGGTLLVTADGHRAIAADPDRDRMYVVDLATLRVLQSLALPRGDEPGRLVEDSTGLVHVVLRRAGAVATIDPIAGVEVSRTAVCAAPRGIAWQAGLDVVHVACADGELVTLPAAGGSAVRTVQLDDDLRDVVVGAPGGGLWVTRFRSAEVLVLDATGAVVERLVPPPSMARTSRTVMSTFVPGVAWRAIQGPDGLLLLHQRAQQDAVSVDEHGYGAGPCGGGVAVTSLTSFGVAGVQSIDVIFSVLGVDVARAPSGSAVAVANAGADPGQMRSLAVSELPFADFATSVCVGAPVSRGPISGAAVAVAYDLAGRLVALAREPATLTVDGTTISLDTTSRRDTGHEIFHRVAGFPIACASCHPEGGDDGHVWDFAGVGRRRTQSLRGGILGTAPFHWNGDQRDMQQIMTDGFVGRMGGVDQPPAVVSALATWIDSLPAPARSSGDPASIGRGEALFASNACADCHSGAQGTNNATVDIGTGGAFQVPWLVGVGARAPYLHDGCAATLDEIFSSCADAGRHQVPFTTPETTDLVAYLKSL